MKLNEAIKIIEESIKDTDYVTANIAIGLTTDSYDKELVICPIEMSSIKIDLVFVNEESEQIEIEKAKKDGKRKTC